MQWDDRHDGASSSGQGSSYVSREPIAGHGKDSPVQPQVSQIRPMTFCHVFVCC